MVILVVVPGAGTGGEGEVVKKASSDSGETG